MQLFYREVPAKSSCLLAIALLSSGQTSPEKTGKKFLFWAGFFLLTFAFSFPKGTAQIVPDATLPVNSTVTQQGNTSAIGAGTRAGGNLFHSFQEFSVPTGGTAFFDNAADIQNIFSRVTGRSISNIDGLLKANGRANLFLLNPNGIIFGPNASLNVGGSFLASTANSINFADGTSFSAANPQTLPLLTVSVPVGLQYGANPGGIQVLGNGGGVRTTAEPIDTAVALRVEPDRTLALVGGDVAIAGGTLKTAGGRIELGSVAGPGSVSLTPAEAGWVLGYEGISTYGNIELSGVAAVDASGAGGGDIFVRSARLRIAGGSQIDASTLGAEPGGRISAIATESIELLGTSPDKKFFSGLLARVFPEAIGSGGNLTIETQRLLVRDGAQANASTLGAGHAGNLAVKVSESVELIGTSADGNTLSGLFTSVARKEATGSGGDITLETGRLIVLNGARLGAFTVGAGNGGSAAIKASESIELSGTSVKGEGIALSARSTSSGNAGSLRIETGVFSIRDRGKIIVSSIGSGDAGTLDIRARQIVLDNAGGINADTVGAGGNINLRSPVLILRNGSTITTNARGSNIAGGNITLNADVLAALENSDIRANSEDFRGGQISISATGIFGTQYRPSSIEDTPNSDITATGADPSLSGTVTINTPDVDPSSGLVPLPENVVDVTSLIASTCSSGARAESEFTVTGRGGLPPSPYEAIAGEATWMDARPKPAQIESREAQQPQEVAGNRDRFTVAAPQIVEAQGWLINSQGQVELVSRSPIATPLAPRFARQPCPPA